MMRMAWGLLLLVLLAPGCYSKRWARVKSAPALAEDTDVAVFVNPDLEVFALDRFRPVADLSGALPEDAELLGRVDIEAMFLWTRDTILDDAKDYARQLGGDAIVLTDTERWTHVSDALYRFRVYRLPE